MKFWGIFGALAVFPIDQFAKYWVVEVYRAQSRSPRALTPFLDLTLTFNKGVSYSMFAADSQSGRLVLLIVSFCACLVVAFFLWRAQNRLTAIAFGLMLGGALGNIVDRWRYGAVVDFLHLHTTLPVGPLANYVFNPADVGITAAVILLIFEALTHRPSRDTKSASGETEVGR